MRGTGHYALGVWLMAVLVVSAGYVGMAQGRGVEAGFPLDDAWIHQTYARNLALRGEFAFVPGHPSAGSTAPLWTLLLMPGYRLGLMPFAWTWLVGVGSLLGLALASAHLARALFPSDEGLPLLAALAVVTEWHQVWGAVSGMETVLFAAIAVALLAQAVRWGERWPGGGASFRAGLAVGMLTLVRPEGVLVAGVLVGGLLAHLRRTGPVSRSEAVRRLVLRGLAVAAGMGLLLVPYVVLNVYLSGTPFPNTFYAKQREYSILYAAPFPVRLGRLALPLLAGPLAVLLPAGGWALRTFRGAYHRWLPLLWAVGTWGLYAWRLPVAYQHGRYLMPAIPPLIVYGVGGLRRLWRRASGSAAWVGSRAWAWVAVVTTLIFLVIGANAYATDTAIINGEMVRVARWVNAHTPPDALIAAHDIGALGYFARRPLLDMAGLISPEVIPFIRDEQALLRWLERRRAQYLVTFPSWYPWITSQPTVQLRYRTDTAITRALGQDNMAVYRLVWGAEQSP